ncbi:hypothetical protein LCGC14_2129250, partial [marine sediment metagenome]
NIVQIRDPEMICDGTCNDFPGCGQFTNSNDCLFGECNWYPGVLLYHPAVQQVVDIPGTWKFCASVFDLEVNESDSQCSCNDNMTQCQMMDCMEVEVIECDNTNFEVNVTESFEDWLETW